ncbi:hypothetical protein Cgig2_022918 [Carnegiea gigantea]|uniref:Uncharacterized protein n=1 Tax=Carnegiea gigantea TaxID=171969 RepID=A0A9Q1KQP4_9CARY|nr:hypothetical protein Cgig2_022918 [Carnegiea gigantea]
MSPDVYNTYVEVNLHFTNSTHEKYLHKKIDMHDKMTIVTAKDVARGSGAKSFDDPVDGEWKDDSGPGGRGRQVIGGGRRGSVQRVRELGRSGMRRFKIESEVCACCHEILRNEIQLLATLYLLGICCCLIRMKWGRVVTMGVECGRGYWGG